MLGAKEETKEVLKSKNKKQEDAYNVMGIDEEGNGRVNGVLS